MTPILFVTPGSCGLGSVIALEWLGVPYRLCRLSVADHANPTFRRISPLGEVPALLSKGRSITESFAILHHLGAQDPSGRLIPSDAERFDRLNQTLAYLVSTFHPAFRPIFHSDRFALTETGRREAREAGIGRLPLEFAHVERLLESTGWFAGPAPTIADAYFLGLARWGDEFIDRAAYPNIERLRERMGADPAVLFAMAAEGGALPASSGRFEGVVDLADVESFAKTPQRQLL
jgi:glutathione S-transferase